MPLERRLMLSETLGRFDKLESAEKAAIRKLDAEIGRKDPVDQSRYRSLLRRYHVWVNGLTDAQKKSLRDAPSDDARFEQARKFRHQEREKESASSRVAGIRTGDFGLIGPYEAAQLLKIWNELLPPKRQEIEKYQERAKIVREIREQNKTLRVPFVPFPAAEEKVYDSRLDNDKPFKDQLGPFARRVEVAQKKAEAAHAKGEPVPKRFDLRFTEFLYFEDHKPKTVTQKNLERFSASCPEWLHAMLDPLTADDARNYLTILYRLLYPDPTEMPTETKPSKGSSGSTPKPVKATPKKSGQGGPF